MSRSVAITHSTPPPRFMNSLMASYVSIRAKYIMQILASLRSSFGLGFGLSRDDAGSLFFHYVNDAIALALDPAVHEDRGNSSDDTQYSCHQGHGDTASHDGGVTGAVYRDLLEYSDHTGYRTEQTHQRSNGGDDLD